MAYAVFVTSDRLVVSAHQTQAIAIAKIAELASGHGYTEVNDGEGGHNLPPNFSPGIQYIDTNGVISFDNQGTTDADVQREVQFTHDQFQEWADGLDAISHQISPALAAKVHQWYYWMHYGMFKNIKGSSTNAQKIAWANAQRMGPADAETVAQWCAGAEPIAAPVVAVMVAHPTAVLRWTMAAAVNNSANSNALWTASNPSVADLIGGSWIDGIA